MRVLLSDGCGVASRQTARLLHAAGHEVGVLSPDRLCLCRFTRTVRRLHVVPAAADDPYAWLDRALQVHRDGGYDLLLPTQEQVTVLSRCAGWVADEGIRTVVADFDALAAVYDKVSAPPTPITSHRLTSRTEAMPAAPPPRETAPSLPMGRTGAKG